MSSRSWRAPRRLSGYDPEVPEFWNGPGQRIARRNLLLSVLTEHIGFPVWSLWSVLVLFMSSKTGPAFSAGEKFLFVVLACYAASALVVWAEYLRPGPAAGAATRAPEREAAHV
ncbi:hypothetical protein [Streptomyces aurantiogriseus]|uniref:Uncharacterized protein n=1 Tax=Streptomyces aurantiogriseus TaxID=66870 RepID=A0A918CHP0_9ACTN|nr:hypothetical protein GCM10010251_44410 [Streptomyces aurantiogriseus]